MKAYLVITGTLFALLALAHLLRTIDERARLRPAVLGTRATPEPWHTAMVTRRAVYVPLRRGPHIGFVGACDTRQPPGTPWRAQSTCSLQALSRSSSPTAARSSLMSAATSRSVPDCASIRSAMASAMALSFCWIAWSDRVWVFCSRATSRNVTIVVIVLMINCQVLMSRKTKYDGSQMTTSSTQNAKNGARDTTVLAPPAKRSKEAEFRGDF